jgi:hypothetical protein
MVNQKVATENRRESKADRQGGRWLSIVAEGILRAVTIEGLMVKRLEISVDNSEREIRIRKQGRNEQR